MVERMKTRGERKKVDIKEKEKKGNKKEYTEARSLYGYTGSPVRIRAIVGAFEKSNMENTGHTRILPCSRGKRNGKSMII